MNKVIIFLITLLFMVSCSAPKVVEENKDPLKAARVLDIESIVRHDIKTDLMFFLKKHKQNWTQANIQKCVDLLYAGEEEFNVEYKIVLAIMSVESQYNISAIGKNYNKKKKLVSTDFGLSQQNSKYYKDRYKAAMPFLDEAGFKYDVNNRFDIGLNIYSCYMYLNDMTDYRDLICFSDYISAYNRGKDGAVNRSNNEYYNKFMIEYMSI